MAVFPTVKMDRKSILSAHETAIFTRNTILKSLVVKWISPWRSDVFLLEPIVEAKSQDLVKSVRNLSVCLAISRFKPNALTDSHDFFLLF